MLARFSILWVRVRDSLWFLPAVLTLLATLLAFATIEAERRGGVFSELPEYYWIFGGGADGARGVLTAIAGGLITVTGVVFSVTIVALQLASSQFTPRLLRDFTADRGNQLVLGVFIGTFTYTLLVLRTVHSGLGDEPAFVPRIGVTVAVVLVLLSIAFLIFFINRSARSIQAAAILDRVAKRTLADVDRLFPEQVGHADTVLGAMHPEVDWNEAEGSPYADQNPYTGPQRVGEGVFGRLMADFDNFSVTPEKLIAEGDTVVALGRYRGTHKESNRPLNAQFAHVWAVKDGKVTGFQQYTDTAQYQRVMAST